MSDKLEAAAMVREKAWGVVCYDDTDAESVRVPVSRLRALRAALDEPAPEPKIGKCAGCGKEIQSYDGVVAYTEGTFCNRACVDALLAPETAVEPLDDALRNAHREMAEAGPREEKDRVHHDCCLDAVMDYEGHVRRLAGLPDSLSAALSRVHGNLAAAPETAKAMVDKAMRRAGFSGVPETAIERRPEMEIARAACGCGWCAAGNPEDAPLSETIDCRIAVALRALRAERGDKP